MADGTPLHVDVQLLDPDGNVVDLKPLKAPSPSLYENAIIGWAAEKRTYVKVRLKSDRPLRVSRVVWHCWIGK